MKTSSMPVEQQQSALGRATECRKKDRLNSMINGRNKKKNNVNSHHGNNNSATGGVAAVGGSNEKHREPIFIRDLHAGMRNLTITCIVLEVGNATMVNEKHDARSGAGAPSSAKGKSGANTSTSNNGNNPSISGAGNKEKIEVRTVKVADATACINMSVWNEPGRYLNPGDIIRVTKLSVVIWRGMLILYTTKRGTMVRIGEFFMTFNESLNMSEINPNNKVLLDNSSTTSSSSTSGNSNASNSGNIRNHQTPVSVSFEDNAIIAVNNNNQNNENDNLDKNNDSNVGIDKKTVENDIGYISPLIAPTLSQSLANTTYNNNNNNNNNNNSNNNNKSKLSQSTNYAYSTSVNKNSSNDNSNDNDGSNSNSGASEDNKNSINSSNSTTFDGGDGTIIIDLEKDNIGGKKKSGNAVLIKSGSAASSMPLTKCIIDLDDDDSNDSDLATKMNENNTDEETPGDGKIYIIDDESNDSSSGSMQHTADHQSSSGSNKLDDERKSATVTVGQSSQKRSYITAAGSNSTLHPSKVPKMNDPRLGQKLRTASDNSASSNTASGDSAANETGPIGGNQRSSKNHGNNNSSSKISATGSEKKKQSTTSRNSLASRNASGANNSVSFVNNNKR